MQVIYNFLVDAAEMCKESLIPLFVFFTLVYLCGYIRQKLIFAKKMNKFYDSYIEALAVVLQEAEKKQNEKITKIKPVKN